MNTLGEAYVLARESIRGTTQKKRLSEIERFKREAMEGVGPPQKEMLSHILRFAAEHVPYYKSVTAELADVTDLQQWPVLTKDIMRHVGAALKSDDHEQRECLENTSGGSTGRPVRFIHDKVFRERAEATRRYQLEHILGMKPNMSQVILWGSTRDMFSQAEAKLGWSARLRAWTLNKMGMKTTLLNAFCMTPKDLDHHLETINGEKPDVIHAYAGSLYQLAKHARCRGVHMHEPQRIYTTAETLQPFMRETIEAVFRSHVFDVYGSREVGPLAAEGPGGKLYTFDFFNHIEVVDENNSPVPFGHTGRVLVTALHNHAMPFIRYEIGDMAVRGQPSVVLGPQLGTLDRVSGRVSDQFVSRAGALIHGQYFVNLLSFRDWLDELQVTQTALDAITITYVPLADADPNAMAEIEAKVRLVMGQECRVLWETVDKIPRTKEGKLLYTRSLVARNLDSRGKVRLDGLNNLRVSPTKIVAPKRVFADDVAGSKAAGQSEDSATERNEQ